MKRILTICLFILAVGSGIGTYLMKQHVVEYENQLASLRKTILADKHEIHTLKADWAVLTEPSRLRHMLAESNLKQIQVKQIVEAKQITLTPIPVPPKKPFPNEPDEKDISDEMAP